MHLEKIYFVSEKFPEVDLYPFNLEIFRRTKELRFLKPVTYFIGENGTGKSTLLQVKPSLSLPRIHRYSWLVPRPNY
jgi:predicted ATPase